MVSQNELLAMAERYLLQTYARPAFVLERGSGVELFDMTGRRYLDFVAGIAVNAFGYADPAMLQVISEQAAQLIHTSNLYHTAPAIELAQALAEASFADRVFFCNSGAEAVEGALKFARKAARERYGEGRPGILAFEGSFHGRTMGALAATSREKYRKPFEPVMPGVRFAPYNDLLAAEQAFGADLCAVIVEPIQGEGGLRSASPAFLRGLRELCDRHGALLIFDEIQCGLGRTGRLWAHEESGVTPDIMVLAKPLGGGLPIGAILLTEAVAQHIHVGDHGSTFAGSPLVCAVALAAFHRLSDPVFLAHVREVGDYLTEQLEGLREELPQQVLEHRGRGLMQGLRLTIPAAEVQARAMDRGLLVATAGEDILRMVPPLIVEKEHIDEALSILRQALV
ncbi:MAG: acetylornithine aminotransferase [Herpetosiphonaceae bacterium]|nr:MAG: acetylornithine aminotransferase [Herpetosiphonaceae bacterium]